MKALFCSLVALVLGGCVYIPGSVVGRMQDARTGNVGQHCVSRETVVGDHLRMPEGGVGEVVKLEGPTYRCREEGRPIRAKLVPVASA